MENKLADPTSQNASQLVNESANSQKTPNRRADKRPKSIAGWIVGLIFTYIIGLASGYGLRSAQKSSGDQAHADSNQVSSLTSEIYPEGGYTLPVSFGDLGPQMVESGVIDRAAFIAIYEQAKQPLTEELVAVLDGKYAEPFIVNQKSAYFLLNFLWALGLVNQNEILDSGPIQQNGNGDITGFASTGGWTLSTRPIREIFSSRKLVNLTAEQQARVDEAAQLVYRPCCNNPTNFPDCNHGMAMLGLLELMGSQNADVNTMLQAAKYVNAYWYPQQTLEQAAYFKMVESKSYTEIDARTLLGEKYSSGSGFAAVHQYLDQKGWLPQTPKTGGSCGV